MGGGRRSGRERKLYSEPVSPSGRIFLRQELEVSIDCFVTFQKPIDVAALKSTLASSLTRNCPRLRSKVIIEGEGRYRWKELPEIDIDNHVIIVPEEGNEDEDNQVYINEYLVALPSLWPLKRETPPWEVHVLPPRRRSLVMRFHHTLGDCVSLLAVLLSGCDIADEILPLRSGEKISFLGRAWRAVKGARYTIGYVIEHSMHAVRRKEDMPLIPREDGLERSPRKLASLSLSLEDMKAVKNKLDATINDVLVAIISSGIEKYLDLKSSEEHTVDADIMGAVAVNLRGKASKDLLQLIRKGKEIKWGNRVGSFLLPIHLKKRRDDPLEYVREAKAILDRKKISGEAQYAYKINSFVMSVLGLEAMASLNYKFRHNTSLLISNMVGPTEAIPLSRNLVTGIGVTLSSLPAALDVHMISYNGKAFLQFLVAREIIPDPEVLCVCVQDGLREMKAKL